MRDRETDSWWSIITSSAIGGEMEGAELVELPVSEKATWRDWRARHPETLVLSIDGREHVESDPYADYFASDRTFRDIELEDRRLAAKEPIWAAILDGEPLAVPHRAVAGGRLFELEGGTRLFLHRPADASMFASSRAWRIDGAALEADPSPAEILARLEAGALAGAEPVAGIDTFWYNWVLIHADTALLATPGGE